MTRQFGIECELAGGTAAVLEHLGLRGLHSYHCSCPQRCTPFRQSPDWTAQADCTADGEIISRVLDYGSPEATLAIDKLTEALRVGRARTSTDQGVHIHVDEEGMTPEAWVRLWRLWFRYNDDIQDMARGRWDEVRSYNTPNRLQDLVGEPGERRWTHFWNDPEDEVANTIDSPFYRGNQIAPHSRHGTTEFRIWNTTRVGWRLHLAVGVSVGLVEAAISGDYEPVRRNDHRPLIDFLAPHLSDGSFAAYLRYAHYRLEEAA